MGIKRSSIGVVTMAVVAAALAIGLSAVKPDVYYDMNRDTGVARLIVASDSATTSSMSPDVYYDM